MGRMLLRKVWQENGLIVLKRLTRPERLPVFRKNIRLGGGPFRHIDSLWFLLVDQGTEKCNELCYYIHQLTIVQHLYSMIKIQKLGVCTTGLSEINRNCI